MTSLLIVIVTGVQTHLFAQAGPSRLGESKLAVLTVRNEAWQNPYACGPNCLFVFLRLHGREVSHYDLLASIPVSDRGVSLQSLKEQAELYNVPVMVAHAGPRELDSLLLPVIAHQGQGQNNHYVVLCEVGRNMVTIIDGGSGSIEQITRSQFEQMWSGYLLVTVPRWWLPEIPLFALIVLSIGFLCLHPWRRKKTKIQRTLEQRERAKDTNP